MSEGLKRWITTIYACGFLFVVVSMISERSLFAISTPSLYAPIILWQSVVALIVPIIVLVFALHRYGSQGIYELVAPTSKRLLAAFTLSVIVVVVVILAELGIFNVPYTLEMILTLWMPYAMVPDVVGEFLYLFAWMYTIVWTVGIVPHRTHTSQ